MSKALCSALSSSSALHEIHSNLRHRECFILCVLIKNLLFSISDVKSAVSSCKIYAEIKPQFYRPNQEVLMKAFQPMERLSTDFKGPVKLTSGNHYLLIIVDNFLCFPLAFPCKSMTSSIVTQCLAKLFAVVLPFFLHSDNAGTFALIEFKTYLMKRGIASSKSSIHHLAGNGQAERTLATVWMAV